MHCHSRVARLASRTSLVATLALLFTLGGCGRQPGPWTSGRPQSEAEVEFQVDAAFEHVGPTWVEGEALARDGRAEFWRSEDGQLTLRFVAGEWYAGHMISITQGDEPGQLHAGASTYSDFARTDAWGDPWGSGSPVTTGRVQLSTLDWESGEPVHCEFSLRVKSSNGRKYSLRGSGIAALPALHL